MRVAIVHDDLTQRGGAERVVESMHQIWPLAPIYTSVYDEKGTFSSFSQMDIRTSFMQQLPFASNTKYNKLYLSLFPIAFETLDLRGYDVVISHGTRFSHGVITSVDTCHIHYCHTPARFAWRYHEYVEEGGFGEILKKILPFFIHQLRIWDHSAAQRADVFFSNSYNIARRVAKYYGRDSDILYPPVETDRFFIVDKPKSDFFLIVSRLLPYKRIDLAISACNQLKISLKIVGTGSDMQRLKKLAGPTVEILGRVPDGKVEQLFADCRAFIFPGEEDFGIAPLEAMASGRPVIAYRAGGAMETVIEGVTGLFFNQPTPEALMHVMGQLDQYVFDPNVLRAHAETFSTKAFQDRLKMLVQLRYSEHVSRFNKITSKK